MTKSLIGIIILSIIIFISCADSSQTKNTNKQKEEVIYRSGTFQQIICSNDHNESYTAYFPLSYNTHVKSPIVFVFDAHARGKMAAKKFKMAADNFGYIIVASNNAKNGLKTINHTINTFFEDVFLRFNIDLKRVYTAGFSGGAKIASSIAIQKGGIAGVISIAAGLPQTGQQISNFFDFAAIVGIKDFNYLELYELNKQMETLGLSHRLFVTDTGHEWPTDSTLNLAVEWLQIKAIKKRIAKTDDTVIRNFIDHSANHINKLILKGKVFEAKRNYEEFLATLKDLIDIGEYLKSYNVLLKNPEINKQKKAFKLMAKKEGDKQQLYISYFKNHKFSLIQKEINLQIKQAEQNYSAKRLLNYLSMLSFIFTDNSIKQSDWQNANNYLNVYKIADKNNPDVYFFEALIYENSGKTKNALASLNKAVNLGFSDIDRLHNPVYFKQINALPEFDLIIKKIKSLDNNLSSM